ncbi:MAG: DUF4878 domain-containing protein [Kiritimatiellia bacterium]
MDTLIKLLTIAVCVGSMLNLTGCGGAAPDRVAVAFVQRMNACDFEGCKRYVSSDGDEFAKAMNALFGDKEIAEMKQWKDAKVEVVNVQVDGDKAEVSLKKTSKAGKVSETSLSLVKMSGGWKVEPFK